MLSLLAIKEKKTIPAEQVTAARHLGSVKRQQKWRQDVCEMFILVVTRI